MADFKDLLWRARLRHALRLPAPIRGGADWPITDVCRMDEDDNGGSTTYLTTLNRGAANTKGTYTTLFASTPVAAAGVYIAMQVDVNTLYLLDLAVGGAGSEKVVLPNLPMVNTVGTAGAGDTHGMVEQFVPIAIRKGSRLAARIQNNNGGAGVSQGIHTHLLGEVFGGVQPPSRWVDWGTDTANSRGTAVTTSASANTKGSYAQLAASLDFTSRWILLCLGQSGALALDNFKIDMAIGPASGEKDVFPNFATTLEHQYGPRFMPLRLRQGERLSMRAQAASAGAKTFYASVLGGA